MSLDYKIGILGGGQLGKMLLQSSSGWDINSSVLDPNSKGPAANLCNTFVNGDFHDYQAVYDFGKTVDLITIEIENVNTDALVDLEKLGKIVHPAASVIRLIQDKGLQKEFYKKNNLPSSDFRLFESATEIRKAYQDGEVTLPFVQKLRRDGYDGRGVSIIKSEEDFDKIFDQPSVVESLIDIDKELSIIIARNGKGEVKSFPITEMVFNPKVNLVEFLFAPASIDEQIASEAQNIANKLINALEMQGILAIELFLTKEGKLLINEVAPRPHNSGHHTIEANFTSQYEQHLRAILNLPLGSTAMLKPSVMINLLGEDNYTGKAVYEGLEESMQIEGANIHIYGKKQTKPYRKMGHVTVLDNQLSGAQEKAKEIKNLLKIKA